MIQMHHDKPLQTPRYCCGSMVREISMKRLVLIVFALAAGAAFSQPGSAQTNVTPSGIFQLNVAKSKFPGAALKSQTLYFDGQKAVVVGIDAQGNGRAIVFEEPVPDGKPHPVTGFPQYNSSSYTQVDAQTINFTRFKDGKVVQTGNSVISSDGKTWTSTFTNAANGQQTIQVYEKQ
jgi:hypothetical protein